MKLELNNFDARIKSVTLKSKNIKSSVIFDTKMYDEKYGKMDIKIKFYEVALIDFEINLFSAYIGAEGFGLYSSNDDKLKLDFIEKIFAKRLDVFLLSDYDYDSKDDSDMLNYRGDIEEFKKNISDYKLYIQYIDAGFYILLAKTLEIANV